jgi:hypothetical protein
LTAFAAFQALWLMLRLKYVTHHTPHVTLFHQAAVQMAPEWDKAHARVVDALQALGDATLSTSPPLMAPLLLFNILLTRPRSSPRCFVRVRSWFESLSG